MNFKKVLKKLIYFINRYLAKYIALYKVTRLPEDVIQDLGSWANSVNSNSNHGCASFELLSEEEVIERTPPNTIHEKIPSQFKEQYSHTIPPNFVITIPKARVWGEVAIITPNNYLLEDISQNFGQQVHPIFQRLRLSSPKFIRGKIANIAAGGGGYFHWMFDILPRIRLLERAGFSLDSLDYFIVNSYNKPYQEETLKVLGIRKDKALSLENIKHIKVEKLVTPSFPGRSGHPPKWVCDFLRQKFLSKRKDNLEGRKIYISRESADRRKLVNEDQVWDFLESHGFDKVKLESLSVKEQARLMNSAAAVVAPHGAGLANLVFCESNTKVLEIFSDRYINPVYWALSEQVGLDYHFLVEHIDNLNRNERLSDGNADISVDIDLLDKGLLKAGII